MSIDTIIEGIIGREGRYSNNPAADDIRFALDTALDEQSALYAATPRIGPNRRDYECSAPNCSRKGYAAGYCNAHYIRARQGRDLTKPLRNRKRSAICVECGAATSGKGGWHRCARHYRKARSVIIKTTAVALMGGQCSRCSQSFPLPVYDFHHVGSKTDTPSRLIANASVEEVAEELSKCVLLCANCHRMEHANER